MVEIQGKQEIEDIFLPALRSDIQLNEAPPEPEGTPTWTLYDPVANKYYKIGWLEFECLVRFKECPTASQLIERLKAETTLDPDEDTIKSLVLFLVYNNLVQASAMGLENEFESQRERLEKPFWERIIHSYLFFMLPLFKPQDFLRKTYPYISFLFTRQFMTGIFILLFYGVLLSTQRIDEMVTTFMSYLNFEGIVLFLFSTIIVKIIHELGHAYTATKYGVPVTTIGIAFIVLYPVLYTETTNAWKLQSRRDRLHIAGGGLMAEFALSAVTLLLWHMLTPGIAQSLCFMVAIVSLAASLVINLNPLMRFDGYYLFSDIVGVDNLQDRSFAFAKWRLRKFLWGWNDPLPEVVTEQRRDLLIAFGFATWVYRFFLYVGIALLVYHIFFQPLGLILMLIELAFFIGLPIAREIKVWFERFTDALMTWRGKFVIAIAVLALLSLFVPLDRTIEIPAVIHARNYTKLYPSIAAKVEEVAVRQGDDVKEGQRLFLLSSPELDYNIRVVSGRLKNLQEIRDRSQADPDLANKWVTLAAEIERNQRELDGYHEIKDKLDVRAPFSGQIKDMDQSLRPGQWVSIDLLLAFLVDNTDLVASGYVREQDIQRLQKQGAGTFYAEHSLFSDYPVVLTEVDETSVSELFWTELSSLYGGPIPSEREGGRIIRPLPRYTYYSVQFRLASSGHAKDTVPNFVVRGAVRYKATAQSVAKSLINNSISFLIRESGL